MMEPIFHDGKKNCVGDQKLRDWIEWFVAINSVFWGKTKLGVGWECVQTQLHGGYGRVGVDASTPTNF